MIEHDDHWPCAGLLYKYQSIVAGEHPNEANSWPLLNGWGLLSGTFGTWAVAVFQDAGFTGMTKQVDLGELTSSVVGVVAITANNREEVRARLETHFTIGVRDAIFLFAPDNDIETELKAMLARHERAMGLSPPLCQRQ